MLTDAAAGVLKKSAATREMLNKSTSEMKREAHGTEKTRHNMKLGEFSSTTQRSDSLAQAFMQRFLSRGDSLPACWPPAP